MPNDNYTIRTMSRDELDLAVEWAAREGWNPGVHDAETFYAADPEGFFVGLLDDEPIATISAVRYGKSFGFVGLYLVKPEYRHRGYGIRIWRAALRHVEGRNVGLGGVVAQQDNYTRSGFTLAYRNVRHEGSGAAAPPGNAEIVKLRQVPLETVLAYDRRFFPEARVEFLEAWINQADSRALGIMRDGGLTGCGVIRKCRNGHKIGPLFADDADLAKRSSSRSEPI